MHNAAEGVLVGWVCQARLRPGLRRSTQSIRSSERDSWSVWSPGLVAGAGAESGISRAQCSGRSRV